MEECGFPVILYICHYAFCAILIATMYTSSQQITQKRGGIPFSNNESTLSLTVERLVPRPFTTSPNSASECTLTQPARLNLPSKIETTTRFNRIRKEHAPIKEKKRNKGAKWDRINGLLRNEWSRYGMVLYGLISAGTVSSTGPRRSYLGWDRSGKHVHSSFVRKETKTSNLITFTYLICTLA